MDVLWIGSDLIKAYHDPRSDRVDVISSRIGEEGEAWSGESGLAIVVDQGGTFCTLEVPLPACAETGERVELARPDECPSALEADVEVPDGSEARWHFDAARGTLRVVFDGVAAESWGRLGDNLVWLALDDEARLAAIVVEGVSRDPGGAGQAAWLGELGVG